LSSGSLGSDGEEDEEWRGISDEPEENSVTVVDHTVPASRSTKQAELMDRKAFMSSSISKMTAKTQPSSKTRKQESELEKEERSNLENDTLLQRMIHTQLLSGSLDPELNLTPAQRKKALAGRIEEVTGSSKTGKGEDKVRKAEHDRSAKHIRDGIRKKKAKVLSAKLEESKELGNYHPALKKVLGADEEKPRAPKRVRGLGLGVGKFKGGVLHLSREEIQGINGRPGNRKGGSSRKKR